MNSYYLSFYNFINVYLRYVKTVQRLMGHKDITVTLNTYTSVLEQFKERELDKVNQYYLNENLIGTNLISAKNDNEKEL